MSKQLEIYIAKEALEDCQKTFRESTKLLVDAEETVRTLQGFLPLLKRKDNDLYLEVEVAVTRLSMSCAGFNKVAERNAESHKALFGRLNKSV